MGYNADGEKIKDFIKSIIPILQDEDVNVRCTAVESFLQICEKGDQHVITMVASRRLRYLSHRQEIRDWIRARQSEAGACHSCRVRLCLDSNRYVDEFVSKAIDTLGQSKRV